MYYQKGVAAQLAMVVANQAFGQDTKNISPLKDKHLFA